MTEPEQTTVEPGTPLETPSTEAGSEEIKPTEGTPAESNPEEGTSEKSPEQLKEDSAHWQKKHQESQERLKSFESGLAQPESLFETKAEPEPDKKTVPATTSAESQEDMDLAKLLEENPALGLAAVADHLDQRAEDRFQKAENKRQFQSDANDAERALKKFSVENKYSVDEYNAAVSEIKAMKISGHPQQIATLMAERMEKNRLLGGFDQAKTQAAADAAQAVKTQQLTTQPDGGSPPAPAGPKTPGQILGDKFSRPSGRSQMLDRLLTTGGGKSK